MSNRSIYLGIIAGLAGIGIWLWRVSVATSETPPDSSPEVAEMPASATPQEPPPTAVEIIPAPPPVVADPQLDVHTAAADMADLLRAGDLANFVARYIPPEMRAQMGPDQLVRMAEGMAQANIPGTRDNQQVQQMIQALDAIKNMEPTLNDTGDEATYQTNASGAPRIRFIKVDGHWYFRG